jgi:hypothetical protein
MLRAICYAECRSCIVMLGVCRYTGCRFVVAQNKLVCSKILSNKAEIHLSTALSL